MELYANYVYTSMAFYYERDDVALPGFAKDFKKPERDEWGTGLDGMKAALELEKQVNQSIIDLHALAGEKADGQMTHFLDDFLEEQVDGIKEIADHVTRLIRAGPGLGEFLYDKELA